jgi:competence protein ComGC
MTAERKKKTNTMVDLFILLVIIAVLLMAR